MNITPPRQNPQGFEPVIINRLISLYIELHSRVGSFPKRDQYTTGKHLESVIIEIISLAIHAKNKTGKSEILMLNKIDSLLKEFMIFLRIVEKTSILKTSGYAVLSEKTLEAGKILGGWIKNTKSDPL